MKVEQIYTGCLSQAAYYIESEGEAAIIDPLRDSKPYMEKALEDEAKIKYVFETHFHADFVSGHQELAEKTGATIIYGPNATSELDITNARDGEEFSLGNIRIKVIHTPGHTMESSSFLLIDEEGQEHALFTGDTLFLGDVGRPDLAVKSDLSQEDLAAHLYHSIYDKIMPLQDELIIYPGHGAGSACGKNMSKETVGTLGEQKKSNYALQNLSKEEFIKSVTKGLSTPPQYFPKNVTLNKAKIMNVESVKNFSKIPYEADDFESLSYNPNTLILDTRNAREFSEAFVPGSVNIGLKGQFASWVGTLITDLSQSILLVTSPGEEEEAIERLARVGYDNVVGYLKNGIESWKKAGKDVHHIDNIEANDFSQLLNEDETIHVLDVRNENEFISQHLDYDHVVNHSLSEVNQKMDQISQDNKYYIHCAGGYRSMIFASILKARGFDRIVNISGGYGALKHQEVKQTEYVCPSSLV